MKAEGLTLIDDTQTWAWALYMHVCQSPTSCTSERPHTGTLRVGVVGHGHFHLWMNEIPLVLAWDRLRQLILSWCWFTGRLRVRKGLLCTIFGIIDDKIAVTRNVSLLACMWSVDACEEIGNRQLTFWVRRNGKDEQGGLGFTYTYSRCISVGSVYFST
jgi:hypothetical protein